VQRSFFSRRNFAAEGEMESSGLIFISNFVLMFAVLAMG
jgi:hypothetical protein